VVAYVVGISETGEVRIALLFRHLLMMTPFVAFAPCRPSINAPVRNMVAERILVSERAPAIPISQVWDV
jgi:hypothetical protein